jgi:hypothetical protein
VNVPLAGSDVVQIEVIDSSDNRQIYKKTVERLRDDCTLPGPIDPEVHP